MPQPRCCRGLPGRGPLFFKHGDGIRAGMMRAIWTGFVAAVLSVGMVAAPLRAETLADALIAAYRNSHLLDQNQAVLRAADEDSATALASLRPVMEFTASGGWQRSETSGFFGGLSEGETGSVGLSIDVVLWAGGRGRLGVEVARESVLATRQALVAVEQQVLLAAVSAYVDVRLQAEIVDLRQSNVRLITQELRAAQDRFDVGEVTLTDVALARSRLAAAQAGLAAAEGSFTVAREAYKAATGKYPGNLAGLPKLPATAKTVEAARAVAKRTHPDILRSQFESRAADLRIKVAKGAFSPTITGGISRGLNTVTGNEQSSVTLNYSHQFYQGGEVSSLYRRALAGKAAADAGLYQTALLVDENVGRRWALLAVAYASIEAGRLQVSAAQTAFDGVREEATLGARTTLDVLNAEQELLSARATKLQAEADRYVGTYQVLSAMGLLTAEHLKLGIPTFDPTAYYDAVKNAPLSSTQGKALDRILGKIAN